MHGTPPYPQIIPQRPKTRPERDFDTAECGTLPSAFIDGVRAPGGDIEGAFIENWEAGDISAVEGRTLDAFVGRFGR